MRKPDDGPTVLGLGLGDHLLLLVGAPALGVVLGYFLPRVADRAVELPWVPMEGPLRLVSELDGVWGMSICLGAGLLLGLAFAHLAITESLKMTLTDSQLRLDRNGKTHTVTRSDVGAVFLDGKKLVVLDRQSRQLVREKPEASPTEVERAFRAYGFPWTAGDPYADRFRRWVPDLPDLPPTVNAVLAAREKALQKKDSKDAVQLRNEVQQLGFVVREEETRQFWRPLIRL